MRGSSGNLMFVSPQARIHLSLSRGLLSAEGSLCRFTPTEAFQPGTAQVEDLAGVKGDSCSFSKASVSLVRDIGAQHVGAQHVTVSVSKLTVSISVNNG